MNVPRLGIMDPERLVEAVPVCSSAKLPMKRDDVIHEMHGKCCNICPVSLPAQKFPPRREEIPDGNDILVGRMQPPSTLSLSLSLSQNASILNRIKEGYLLWMTIVPHIPKGPRYTIGARIEQKFLDLLELAYVAYFTEREKKSGKITECILVLDTLKFLISVAWEGRLISHKQCEEIAMKLDEVGKMFGGWKKNVENPEKKNRTL